MEGVATSWHSSRVEEEGPALLPFRLLPAHRYLVELGDEEAPEERGVLFTDCALGESREEDLALVEGGAKIKSALPGSYDLPHGLAPQESIEAGQDRAQALPGRELELVAEV